MTSNHIAPGAVDTDHLAVRAVTGSHLELDAVTTNRIRAGAVTASKIGTAETAAGTALLADGQGGAEWGDVPGTWSEGSEVLFTDQKVGIGVVQPAVFAGLDMVASELLMSESDGSGGVSYSSIRLHRSSTSSR